jgi:hypothetical protein
MSTWNGLEAGAVSNRGLWRTAFTRRRHTAWSMAAPGAWGRGGRLGEDEQDGCFRLETAGCASTVGWLFRIEVAAAGEWFCVALHGKYVTWNGHTGHAQVWGFYDTDHPLILPSPPPNTDLCTNDGGSPKCPDGILRVL